MQNKSRITSILNATSLSKELTGFPSFHLSELILDKDLDFQLPNNLRLGHLAEKVVAELIKSSTNYEVLYENIQIIEDKKTIGELDFIIQNRANNEILHLELAYKFYLLAPGINTKSLSNWIGPNRKDSLKEKLEKLKAKQFPLLYHNCTKSNLSKIDIDSISQALCMLVSLFIPYENKSQLHPTYDQAVKGYYLNLETFLRLHDPEKSYYLPSKKEWGMDASENQNWTDLKSVEDQIKTSLEEKKAPMCWQKHQGTYLSFFIVWW